MAALIAPLLIPGRPFDQQLEELLDAERAAADIPVAVETPEPVLPEFEVVLLDGSIEAIVGANAYAQEGQMTTFFRTGNDDPIIDAWSERIISIRTADIRLIRRR